MVRSIPIHTALYVSLTSLLESLSETAGGGRKQGCDMCTPHDTSINKEYSEVVGTQVEVWTVPHRQQLEQ